MTRSTVLICMGYSLLAAQALQGAESKRFRLAVEPSLRRIAPCEPLLVTLTLTNTTDKGFELANDGTQGRVAFYVRQDDVNWTLCYVGAFGVIGLRWQIPASEAIAWDDVLFWRQPEHFSAGEFVFPTSGIFILKTRFEYESKDGVDEWSESEPFQITVAQPRRGDIAALAIVRDRQMARALQGGWELGVDASAVTEGLHRLFQEFPKSPYADFATYRLGIRAHTTPDQKDALEYFSSLSTRNPAIRYRAAIYRIIILDRNRELVKGIDFAQLKADLSLKNRVPDGLKWPWTHESAELRIHEWAVWFYDDERLDHKVDVAFDDNTTFGELLESLGKAAGVSLNTDSDWKSSLANSNGRVTSTLREWMWSRASALRHWKSQGDGYFLDHFEETKRRNLPTIPRSR